MAGTERGTGGGDAALSKLQAAGGGGASPLEPQKERRAPGLLFAFAEKGTKTPILAH